MEFLFEDFLKNGMVFGRIMPIELNVQRIIEELRIWPCLWPCLISGLSKLSKKGDVSYIVASLQQTPDLWLRVWNKINEHTAQGLGLKVAWIKAHTIDKDRDQMTHENRMFAPGSEMVDH